jgi:hypothetical protein
MLATCRKGLSKLRVEDNDLLMKASNAEMWKIHKEKVFQLRKRKLSDDDEVVVLADAAKYAAGLAVSLLFVYHVSVWLTWFL